MKKFSSVDFNPFGGQEIQKICLTNESQREIWLSCIFGGESASLAYNQSLSLHFKGLLNVPVLEKSIADLILRHEALRSNFSTNGEQLVIYEDFAIELGMKNIFQMSSMEQNECMKEYIHQEMNSPFDLENGPLLRFCLHQVAPEINILTLTIHHIIADGWSLNTIIADLGYLYSVNKGVQGLGELAAPFQISAYSLESVSFKDSKEYLANQDYWLKLYSTGIPPENQLATDFPRTQNRSYLGGNVEVSLPPTLPSELRALSIQTECSLVTLMLSAFEVFMAKIMRQDELVMGVFSSGRPEIHHQDLISHCVNLLPLKASIDQHLSFKDYLEKRKGEFLDAIDHQHFTFSELIKKLYIPRDSSHVPLVPFVFNFERELGKEISFDELAFECVMNPREHENFELNLSILWKEEKVDIQCTYNKDLFRNSTIRSLLEAFSFFLTEIVSKPLAKIQGLMVERNQTKLDHIAGRNNTFVPLSKEETLLSYFDSIVMKYPEKIAISFQEERLSFKELSWQANQLAHILIENGVKKGDNIGIALSRSPKIIVSMLAILKCGGVYIPLDPDFPLDRIVYMLENSAAKALITSKDLKGQFKTQAHELYIEDCWEYLNTYPNHSPEVHVTGGDLAYILYTSGSTGKPKGVQIRHFNLLNFLLSMQKEPGIRPSDKWLAITTVSFDIAGLEIFLPLISGAEIVLADAGTTRDGAAILSIIKKQGITILQATPATWTMMLYEGWEEKIPLKVLCGGEAFPKSLANKLIKQSAEVWNMYGPTETTIWSTVKRLSLDDEIITVGRPIDNTLIYILDEKLDMVPEGSVGEIYIAGEGLALGYLNRPDLTLEKFIDNPFEPEKSAKIYGTGDLGIALRNGEIQCLGRLDHQVKIRGFRIELGEIEHALCQYDSVKEAIVIAREDQQDDKRLCAYVIPSFNTDPSTEGALKTIWRQKLKETLPSYMLPNDYVFLTKFPLTPNGKIDRKQLPKPGSPITETTEVVALVIPNTTIAQTIATIWADCLGVDSIKMSDDFFQLGGHSLLAVQLMMRIEKQICKKIPLTSLFKYSTFEAFLSLYEDPAIRELSTQSLAEGNYLVDDEIIVPTTESQKEIWLSCVIGGDEANLAYNLPAGLKMTGPFNFIAFKNALEMIVGRHEALRTNISESGESLMIHPRMPLDFEIDDLSMLTDQEQKTALRIFIDREMKVPFKLSEDPLLRVYLHKLGENSHHFTLIIHHIICDGGSMDIIFDELSQLYNAAVLGRTLTLPAAPQISDYSLDQLTFNNSSDFHLTQKYWLTQFQDKVPVLNMPVDYPRTSNRSYKGEQEQFSIGNQLYSSVLNVSKKAKCSMVTTLLSCFELFLYGRTKQSELVVGLPVSGQTGSFFGLVGHCVNLLPIRSSIDEQESFTQYLKRRTREIYDDYDHQNLTYSELLRQLNLKRDPTRVPLVPVVFSMRADEDIVLEGLEHEFEEHPLAAQTFEISVYVIQCTDKLEFTWVYNTDLFTKETIAGFHTAFTSILKQIGENPDLIIKDLPLNQSNITRDLPGETALANFQNLHEKPADTFMPKNEFETLIARIWSEHLNIPDINVKKDFFELGGHSLIAVKIMMTIEREIGKKLPLSILFENSTIEELSEFILTGHKKSTFESLVPIKTSGNKAPIYLVHGWGLNVLVFKSLSESLDPDQPVYGVQAQGLNGGTNPLLDTVEGLAAYYNAEILRNDPVGPYILTGYSFGGILAFEMARQLMAMGKEIKMLGIFDTYASSGLLDESKSQAIFHKVSRQFNKLGFILKTFVKYPKETASYQRFILSKKIKRYFKNDWNLEMAGNQIEAQILKNYNHAYNSYRLSPLDINIDLFRVEKRLYYLDDMKYLGWNKYANSGVTVHDVPGDHETFLSTPNVKQLATILQHVLNERNLA